MTCPETLSENFKEDILRAFSNVKLLSIKGFEFDKELTDIKKEEKNEKIYINSFDNVCPYLSIDPTRTILLCNLTKDIITDKDGNLISSKITNVSRTITDNDNFFINN